MGIFLCVEGREKVRYRNASAFTNWYNTYTYIILGILNILNIFNDQSCGYCMHCWIFSTAFLRNQTIAKNAAGKSEAKNATNIIK